MPDLPIAMRHTNSLLRAQLEEIQRLACDGSSMWLLERKLKRLLLYELDDREVRTCLLARMVGLLKQVGTGPGQRGRVRPPRIRNSPGRA